MSTMHPSGQALIAKKFKYQLSSADATLSSAITVPSDQYGIIYNLFVSIDAGSEADLDALGALEVLSITIGSTLMWRQSVHPKIEDTGATEIRWMDLGPWSWDFGFDGIYTGVLGENITVDLPAFGTGIKSEVSFKYSGD